MIQANPAKHPEENRMTATASDVQVELFTDLTRLERQLKSLHPGAVITTGAYVSDIPGYINDMEWNFYDEIHRFYVHNTYHDMLKVFSGKTFSVNVVKWGNWPVFIQVANAKVAPNLFYQTMSILGIFYVHQIMVLEQLDRQVRLDRRWYTVSHWLFKPLHRLLNGRLMKLQVKQDDEDNEQIRHRRLALRDKGFHFTTDKADFTNSNQLTNHVIFPPGDAEARLPLVGISADAPQNVTVGLLELLAWREGDGVRVWPGICPHEGALMASAHMCDGAMQCPWHGRRFKGEYLQDGGAAWQFLDFSVTVERGELVARRGASVRTKAA